MATFDGIAGAAIAQICRMIQETDYLVELRDALLPKLMSGEIRVRDAEKLAEAVA